VLMSDHGTQLRDHGSFGKGANKLHPFNTQLNLMIRHPEGPNDKDISAFVQNHDLMPTLLNLLDIPCGWTDGEDMWQLVTQEKALLRERIITGWAGFVTGNARGRVSVRDDHWNFCTSVGYQDENGDELFDVRSDSEEKVNVASDHPTIVAERRRDVEALIGQPLPGHFIEVCDPGQAPMTQWLQKKLAEM